MIKLWEIGELIEGRYEVQEVLTRGGMGIVYIVKDVKRPIRFAVKSLRPDLPLNPQRLRRFLSEALIWAELGVHPHIVQAMSVSRYSDSNPLIFLEFVNGNTLRGLLEKTSGRLPFAQILDIALQVCAGMQTIHSKNLVHRDLKPENLLISNEGVLKITDFGISRAFRDDLDSDEKETIHSTSTRLTASGIALGTAPYMSPEQISGDSNISSSSDIFSFGVILYELLTGDLPFKGNTASEIIFSQLSRPRALSTFFPNRSFPTKLDDLVMACLSINPAERPSNFDVLQNELIEVYETFVMERESQSNTKVSRLRLAITFLNMRRCRDALPILDDVISEDPRNHDAWHNKGNALMDLAQEFEWNPLLPDSESDLLKMTEYYRSAICCAERAIELYPQHDWAWNTKGGCLIRIGYFHRALSCLNQAIAINPRYAVAWRNRSNCLRKLGRLKEALSSYKVALALEPRNPDAINGMGVCFALLKRYEEALGCFAEALKVAPFHVQARTNQELWGSIAAGERNMAIVSDYKDPVVEEHLQEVLGLRQHKTNTFARLALDQEADELANRAWGLMNLGIFAEALNVIEHALEIDPRYSTALLHKGRILRRMGRLDEAVEIFSEALNIDPGYDLVNLNRGLALSSIGRYEEAVSDFKVYLQTNSEDPAGWSNLGFSYLQQGDLYNAFENFAKALERDPEDPQTLFGMSQVHLLKKELKEADDLCKKVLLIDPLNADAWYLAGQIAQKESKIEIALDAYARLTEIEPQNSNGWALGALCLNLLGRPPRIVLEWCTRARDHGFPDIRLLEENRAIALYRCGYYREAYNAYDSLTHLYPGDENLQNLKSLCSLQIEREAQT